MKKINIILKFAFISLVAFSFPRYVMGMARDFRVIQNTQISKFVESCAKDSYGQIYLTIKNSLQLSAQHKDKALRFLKDNKLSVITNVKKAIEDICDNEISGLNVFDLLENNKPGIEENGFKSDLAVKIEKAIQHELRYYFVDNYIENREFLDGLNIENLVQQSNTYLSGVVMQDLQKIVKDPRTFKQKCQSCTRRGIVYAKYIVASISALFFLVGLHDAAFTNAGKLGFLTSGVALCVLYFTFLRDFVKDEKK